MLAVLALWGCSEEAAGPRAQGPVPVSVVRLAPKSLPVSFQSVGRTEGSKEVEVRARVSGILEQQVYAEGTAVKAGTTLFRIEQAPFEIQLEQAKAALAQEVARNEQAQRLAERYTQLVAERAVSKNQADDAVSAFNASAAAVQAARADVREAELNLSYTRVISPINGITGRALRSEGTLVAANSDSSLLTTVIQTDPIWVRFALSQSEYETMRKAMSAGQGSTSVTLLMSDGKPHAHQGKLNFASSTIDTTLGTVQLRAEFPNPDLSLLPGQYLQVKFVAGEHEGVAVPQTAVLQNDQGKFVWLMKEDGTAVQRPIQTGGWIGNEWEVRDGLQPGDVVILDNLLKLQPGGAVQVSDAPRPPPPAAPGNARG